MQTLTRPLPTAFCQRSVLFTNRSASHLSAGRPGLAMRDAAEAVLTRPRYGKAWFRLALAMDSLAASSEFAANWSGSMDALAAEVMCCKALAASLMRATLASRAGGSAVMSTTASPAATAAAYDEAAARLPVVQAWLREHSGRYAIDDASGDGGRSVTAHPAATAMRLQAGGTTSASDSTTKAYRMLQGSGVGRYLVATR